MAPMRHGIEIIVFECLRSHMQKRIPGGLLLLHADAGPIDHVY